MHVAQEVDVTEVAIVARSVLAKVMSEENIEFVSLPHDDQPHEPRSPVTELLNDLAQPLGHGVVPFLENCAIHIDGGNALGTKDVTDL